MTSQPAGLEGPHPPHQSSVDFRKTEQIIRFFLLQADEECEIITRSKQANNNMEFKCALGRQLMQRGAVPEPVVR